MERSSEHLEHLIQHISRGVEPTEGEPPTGEELDALAKDKQASADLAKRAFDRGDFGLALTLMENLLSAGHGDHWIYVLVANTHERCGRQQDALDAMLAALGRRHHRNVELEQRILELIFRLRDIRSFRAFVDSARRQVAGLADAAAWLAEWANVAALLNEPMVAEGLRYSALAAVPASLRDKLLTYPSADTEVLRTSFGGSDLARLIRMRAFVPSVFENCSSDDLTLVYASGDQYGLLRRSEISLVDEGDGSFLIRSSATKLVMTPASEHSWYGVLVGGALHSLLWAKFERVDARTLPAAPPYEALTALNTSNPLVAALSEEEKFVAKTILPKFNFDYYAAWNFGTQRLQSSHELVIDFVKNWRHRKYSPSPEFDQIAYLESNDDVRNAGVNPFYHYVVAGEREGRAPKPPGGWKSAALKKCRSLGEQATEIRAYRAKHPRTAQAKTEAVRNFVRMLGSCQQLYIALTHDNALLNPGGIQAIVAWEMTNKPEGSAYLCLYPTEHVPVLDTTESGPMLVTALLDGTELAAIDLAELSSILAEVVSVPKVVVIHQLIGFKVGAVQSLLDELRPVQVKFWLHDYLSVCANWLLLRNDVEHCHAVEPETAACRLCVYHEDRMRHLAALSSLLKDGRLSYIAPSDTAARIAIAGAKLDASRVTVKPHLKIARARFTSAPAASERRVRVAFLGQPVVPKGWGDYLEFVQHLSAEASIDFYIFGARAVEVPLIQHVQVRGGLGNSSEMISALREHEIDFAVVSSVYRETFCLTAYEALTAGCTVLVSKHAGNPSTLVDDMPAVRGYGSIPELVGIVRDHARGLADRTRLASGRLMLSEFSFG